MTLKTEGAIISAREEETALMEAQNMRIERATAGLADILKDLGIGGAE